IALAGLLVLVLAIAPAEPIRLQTNWRKLGHPIGLFGMWLCLLLAGFWNIGLYRQYFTILQDVAALNDCRIYDVDGCVFVDVALFAEHADRLQPLIDADSRQPAYILQQSYLYGLAASEGDLLMAG